MYIPNQMPQQYEQHYYLSRKTLEECKLLIQGYGEQHYQMAVDFLKDYIEKWEFEQSSDGKIHKATMAVESSDKSVQISFKSNVIQISFYNVPMIRESRWDNLISTTRKALTFPNKYLKINTPMVKQLLNQIRSPYIGIPYKALLECCDPHHIDEDIYTICQSGQGVVIQDAIENEANVRLLDDFTYIRVMQAPINPIPLAPRPPEQMLVQVPVNQPAQPHPVPQQNPMIQAPNQNYLMAEECLDDEDLEKLEKLS